MVGGHLRTDVRHQVAATEASNLLVLRAEYPARGASTGEGLLRMIATNSC